MWVMKRVVVLVQRLEAICSYVCISVCIVLLIIEIRVKPCDQIQDIVSGHVHQQSNQWTAPIV